MGIPKSLTKKQAPAELNKFYEIIQKDLSSMSNVFGVIARFPSGLKTLIPFYEAVMHKGNIEAKYKGLAYLKASSVNDCRY